MIHEMTSEYRATFRTVQYGKASNKESILIYIILIIRIK